MVCVTLAAFVKLLLEIECTQNSGISSILILAHLVTAHCIKSDYAGDYKVFLGKHYGNGTAECTEQQFEVER